MRHAGHCLPLKTCRWKRIFHKIHEKERQRILACADKELIGKRLVEGDLFFEIKESFYKGKPINEGKLGKLLKEMENINLVGEKAVEAAKKTGLVKEEDIVKIKNVPHVQIYRI